MKRTRRNGGEKEGSRTATRQKSEVDCSDGMKLRRSSRSSAILPSMETVRSTRRAVPPRAVRTKPKKVDRQVNDSEIVATSEAEQSTRSPRRRKRQKESLPMENDVAREQGEDQVKAESVEDQPNQYAEHLADAMLLMPTIDVSRRVGRRTKMIPEERMLLAQLYHDHFALYHSRRYISTNYYIYPDSNLRSYLLHTWADRLNRLMLGCFQRTSADIEEFIGEMITEVKDHRQVREVQASPACLLLNKVYDHVDTVHPEVEEILDKFEQKLILDREHYLLRASGSGIPWRDGENQLLLSLYQATPDDYNINVLRREGADRREELLSLWSTLFTQKGYSRTPRDIERKICAYRKEYRVYKENESKIGKKARKALSPLAIGLGKEWLDGIDQEMNLDKVITELKPIQEEILKGEAEPETSTSTEPVVDTALLANLYPNNPVYDLSTHTCRTNRPHMSRRERHLLAMLYRKNSSDYEQFNSPHMARKSAVNKKWTLLKEWAEMLSTLGVSQREPEELATKISQYKNIVKNHKQCSKDGVNSLIMKSDYKIRRIQRALTPTTKFFDLSDTECDEEATEENIKKYLEESHSLMNYQYAAVLSTLKKHENTVKGNVEQHREEETKQEAQNIVTIKEEPETNELEEQQPTTSAHVTTVADYLFGNVVHQPAATQKEETTNSIFESIYADCKQLENTQQTILTYDVIDMTGIVTKMAINRVENHRDVNFYLWTKYMDIELDQQLSLYVCYMCDDMTGFNGQRQRHRGLHYTPVNGILAQQSLPTVAISGSKEVHISWCKSNPKHRCVPFLMSTICEKLASLSHMIARTTDIQTGSISSKSYH